MEETKPSQTYIKGYNAGYTLNKHEPVLLEQIFTNENRQHEFIKAMRDGQKQYQKEQLVENMRKQLDQGRDQSRDRGE